MDPIFTVPFSEYEAINELKKKLKGGCSFYVPTSRQQKGIDFIIHNNEKNQFLRVQVKSSRSYVSEPRVKRTGTRAYKYTFLFSNFMDKYKPGNADYYLLFGLYPMYNTKANIKSRKEFWKTMILCLSEKEMFVLLQQIRRTGKDNIDRFFCVGFDEPNEIYGARFNEDIDLSKFLLHRKLNEISEKLRL